MDASPDGTIQARPIDSVAKINIGNKNQAAAKIASKISFAVLKEAAGKAKSIAPSSSGSYDSDSPSQEKTKGSNEKEKSEEDNEGSNDKDMRGTFLKQSKLNLRSLGGAEVIAQSRASSDSYSSVEFTIDPATGETIVTYSDEFGNVIKSEIASEETLEELKTSSNSMIEIIATEVFLEQLELGIDYEKSVNSALQEAIRISKSILANVNLSNSLPSANTWKASDLIHQFSKIHMHTNLL